MKKLFVGCLVVALLAGVALAVGGYFAWRLAQPYVEQAGGYVEGLRRLGDLAELDRKLERTEAYTPVATGELDQAQVERFVRVQERVRGALGTRFTELQQKYQQLEREFGAGRRTPSFAEGAQALAELSGLFVEARRAQVDALNAEGFSQGEYEWVRARVYQAGGLEVTGFSLQDLQRLARQGADAGVTLPEVTLPEVPARNRELVRPHVPRLKEWAAMAFFGL